MNREHVKGIMLSLIERHQGFINELKLIVKHDFEFKPGSTSDLAIFSGEQKLVVLKYWYPKSTHFPDLCLETHNYFSGSGFIYYVLFDGHYFHLMQVNVFEGFPEHIIPIKSFLYRVSQDSV